MTPQMKAMFEAENLSNASPATVSRAGIIYVPSTELGWAPIVASWLKTRSPTESAALKPLFDKLVDAMLTFVRSGIMKSSFFAMEISVASKCSGLSILSRPWIALSINQYLTMVGSRGNDVT